MSIRSRFAILLLAGMVAAPVGCGKKSPTFPTDATPALPVASTGPAVTPEEAMEFGKQFVASIKTKDRAKFDKLMRIEDFCARCVQDMGFSSQERAAVVKGMTSSNGGLIADLMGTCENGSDLILLGVRSHRGRAEVVLRVFGPDGTNYFICTPARFPDGSIAMEDLLMAASGEPMSLTLRRLMITLLVPMARTAIKIPRQEQAILDNIGKSRTITQAIRDKDFAKALMLLKTLPREMQNEKQFVLLAVFAGQGIGDETYLQEIERFMELFPGDPALDLMTIDYWLLKSDWKRGLECIDRLDAFVGGDPYLNQFRVSFLIKAGRLDDAKRAAEKLLVEEPKLLGSYNTMALCQVKANDFAGAVGTFKKAIVKFGALDLDPLASDPDYGEFVKSKEYADLKKWAEARLK